MASWGEVGGVITTDSSLLDLGESNGAAAADSVALRPPDSSAVEADDFLGFLKDFDLMLNFMVLCSALSLQ